MLHISAIVVYQLFYILCYEKKSFLFVIFIQHRRD